MLILKRFFFKRYFFKLNFLNLTTPILWLHYTHVNIFLKKNVLTIFTNNILLNFFFFKKKNFNKLYFFNKFFLLSPGIVLKFNNLKKKKF